MDRVSLLVDIDVLMKKYTDQTPYRPAISDFSTYNALVEMCETDEGEFIWNATPDEVMQHILDTNTFFSVEYGWEDLYDSLRDYVIDNDFVTSVDDIEEEEE